MREAKKKFLLFDVEEYLKYLAQTGKVIYQTNDATEMELNL